MKNPHLSSYYVLPDGMIHTTLNHLFTKAKRATTGCIGFYGYTYGYKKMGIPESIPIP